ncbi:MAG: HupE/UreJ family protein [Myxococcota bacterium]|nr:HupE/UreJ family protein [Myxococcota bacterium]
MRPGLWGIVLALGVPGVAGAHQASDSLMTVSADGKEVAVRWDIALRDLDRALVLDRDGDGKLTGAEVRDQQERIAGYALSRLGISTGAGPCHPGPVRQQWTQHSDGAYQVLSFQAACDGPAKGASLDYRLLFDVDPLHRGLIRFAGNASALPRVASPQSTVVTLEADGATRGAAFVEMVRQGIWHIWIGLDHILFLLALLLPAVLRRDQGNWVPSPGFWPAAREVLKVVTAFTVAHSITLAAAEQGWVSFNPRLVEVAIAISVAVAALNNLWPLIPSRWMLALPLGLLHGFGFSTVLRELGAAGSDSLLGLLAFNLGVELGQLAIVAAFLPLAYLTRTTRAYRWGAMVAGSSLIALVAIRWSVERALGV